MMILKSFSLALLLSSTAAAGIRRINEETLGELFLEAVANATDPDDHHPIIQRDGSFNAEVKGEFMAPLSKDISDTCIQLGRIEYSNSNSDSQTGEMQSFSLNCRFDKNETYDPYDAAWKVMVDTVMRAKPTSTSFSNNLNTNYVPNMLGQQKGLEMLMKMANTIEELVLVVPMWQNAVSNYNYPFTSSISVNINKIYVDPSMDSITDDDMIVGVDGEAEVAVAKSNGK